MLILKMKNNITKETKTINVDLDWINDFIWSEGNFSCDCNRQIFFDHNIDKDIECSSHIYTILSIHNNDKLVYTEKIKSD